MFLSAAGDRTHIGTYVGVSPPLASNENNKIKNHKKVVVFYFIKVIHSFASQALYSSLRCGIIKVFLAIIILKVIFRVVIIANHH